METLIIILLLFLAVYLVMGFLFAIAFCWRGVDRVDAHAAGGSWGFRILILPGAALLWPLLAQRWMRGRCGPPEEHNAHRQLSHQSS